MNTQLLNGIVIFKQVVDCGSFTEAANTLNHSKSYISGEINKLESRLGIRLLNRTTRKISLTSAGEIYYRQCQNIINDAVQVEQQLAGQQKIPKGNLRISCPVSFALAKIKPILGEYMDLYPQVVVELELNDQLVDVIADGYDLALRASEQLPDSSLISRKLTSVEIVTIAAPSYLNKWGTPRYPDELVHHRTINFRSTINQNIWQYQDEADKQTSVKVNSHLTTNSAEMELAMCKDGQGIARVPKLVLTDEIENGNLVLLFDDFQPISVDIFLIYPNRKYMPSRTRSFIDFLISKMR
ncbi:LysR family transcriptional regulator [Marinomonas transparens]|uniref:LysR family transcriptional regulator n=1 Tax=Marinomonas transparens TaxID=2795388 RepID=A0A934N5X0_9GAMM|nr:LysR family transcriptional regulator [Marinomonas transparens]MBJ7537476.1 LysR family transcriptional regulator [Marinomonas transparens]